MLCRLRFPQQVLKVVRTMAAAADGGANDSSSALTKGQIDKEPKSVTDAEWRKVLTPEQYGITREAKTETPYTGTYDKHFANGTYVCVCCGASLFESEAKFDSGCGWPAFHTAHGAKGKDETDANVTRHEDNSISVMPRTEVRCKQCAAHLGHVFKDGPRPTGERFCINSVAMNFSAKE